MPEQQKELKERQGDRSTSARDGQASSADDHIVGTDIYGQPVTDRILTVPNVISFIRLCMIPLFFVLLLQGNDGWATLFFGLAAATDFLDGTIARSTHTVSKLGQVLDPAVDRLLMIMGVIGVFIVGRLPLWIIVLIFARDVMMLCGGSYALKKYDVRVDVIFPGKLATALLFFGLFGLLWNWPLVPGLAVCDFSWLPGFTGQAVSWGIWCVYAGIVIGVFTTSYYVTTTIRRCLAVRSHRGVDEDDSHTA